jgi:hypothetical protein
MIKTLAMSAYVGRAKERPDSFTPRRFTTVSSTTMARLISTTHGPSPGNADARFATPDAMETATVRM